jgi:hypothetical protein
MFSPWLSPEKTVCPYCGFGAPTNIGGGPCIVCKKPYFVFIESKTLKLEPDEKDKESFYNQIWSLLQQQPVENGYNHPIDDYFDLLCKAGAQSLLDEVLTYLLTADNSFKKRRDDLILLIGRIKPEFISDTIFNLTVENLSSGSTSIVDATVQCLESWGGKRSLDVLVKTKTGTDWIDSYIKDVVSDLMKGELGYAS